jgi:hypothetical protein
MQAGAVLAQPGGGAAKMLEWKTMVGVPTALTGTQVPPIPIRGINGGGVPWNLTSAKGLLRTNGRLEIKVDGLVLATTLSNPASAFKATVSCLTDTGATMNVSTVDSFPATLGLASAGGGDARIEARLELPHPCIAPIVFVTSTGGSWFAITGG